MATAKERDIKAELMRDPAYATAWAKVRQAIKESAEAAAATGGTPDTHPVKAAFVEYYAFLDTRPDLVKLIETAERDDH